MLESSERPWLGHWPKNVPLSIEYPEVSLDSFLQTAASEVPNEIALSFSGTQITYANLDFFVTKFATVLQSVGVKKGDRVVLYLPNIPQFVIAYYAVLRAGAIVVAVSPLYKRIELGHILADSGAEVIVALDTLYADVQVVKNKTRLRRVITTSVQDSFPPTPKLFSSRDENTERSSTREDYGMKNLMAKSSAPISVAQINPKEDVAVLQYTGGTTGIPKGVVLTHWNLVVNAIQIASWLSIKQGKEVCLAALPFVHIYGMTVAVNACIHTRSRIVPLYNPSDIHCILKTIEASRVTIFCGTPATYVSMLDCADIQEYDLQSLRVCVSGASRLPNEVQKKFEILTGLRIMEGYGLTEASPVTHVNTFDDANTNRSGSIGIPISDTDAKIVDLDTGEHLFAGEAGELAVRGPQVMLGYWNNPEETQIVLRNGWLYTGDIAIMDPDGFFRIVDRKKDMINLSGLKVWPSEVEEALSEHPAIKEAAVLGIPGKGTEEIVKAFVVLKQEYEGRVTSDEVKEFCKERLAAYKAPLLVEFRDSLPRTPAGKILKQQLKTTSTKMLQT